MPTNHSKRKWFVCRWCDRNDIEYLVSGFSEQQVRRAIGNFSKLLIVKVAKIHEVCIVFSGIPHITDDYTWFAPQEFTMNLDGHYIEVMILA